jgi:peptidoglycan hydrolase-like protein with peptidoglycan-binding domain
METFAYIHLSAASNNSENIELVAYDLKWLNELNWSKLSTKASIRLLSLTLALVIVGMSGNAFALQRGNSGSQVTAVQQQLTNVGFYNGPITGYYGDLTTAAVIRFQRAKGLAVDGIAGPNTLSALSGTSSSGSVSSGTLLQRGSRGTSVTQLQNQLKAAGYFNGPVTGYYGELTEAAVIRFQRAKGLTVDGIVGTNTLAALNGSSNVATVPTGIELRPGSSGSAVTQVQNRLKALGFYKGPVTGVYGQLTETAVRDFQRSRRITETGIAGPTTLAAMQRSSSGSNAVAVAPLHRYR